MAKKSVFVSVDLEVFNNKTSYGIINMGMCAATEDGAIVGSGLSLNLVLTPEDVMQPDGDTLKWWELPQNTKAFQECLKEPRLQPEDAMRKVQEYIRNLADTYLDGSLKGIVFVFYPTAYDGTLLRNYWLRYLGQTWPPGPFFNCIDLRSYAAGLLGLPYAETSIGKDATKPFLPKEEEIQGTPHTGLRDAEYQLRIFLNLHRHARARAQPV